MKKLTKFEKSILEQMKELEEEDGDYEICHSQADNLLCDLLIKLGYEEIVDSYHKVGKWYA